MSGLKCKKCESDFFVKSGHVRGYQRYKCKACGCQFTDTARRGVDPAIKSFAVVLYAFCGVSMGNIARLFKVSTVAVLKWLRAAAVSVEKEPEVTSPPEIVMVDEFWLFVNGKKTRVGCGEPLMGSRVRLSESSWAVVLTGTYES